MPHPIFQSKLRNKTKALLAEYLRLKDNTYVKIAKNTGLSANWITQFHQGTIHHTDVGRVETLYNYLSPDPLEVQ